MVTVLNKQLTELTGETSYTTQELENYPIYALEIYGKSTQGYAFCGGTPLGKNLIPYPYEYNSMEISGLTFTVIEDGSITVSGTSTATATFRVYGNSSNNIPLTGVVGGKTYAISSNMSCKVVNGQGTARYVNGVVTLAEDEFITYIYVQYAANVTVNTTLTPQIELGAVSTEYEPYYSNPNPDCPVDIVSVGDDGTVSITACGKNLLSYPYVYSSMEMSGLTFAFNTDTSIKISGTATATATFRLYGDGNNTKALAGVAGGKTYAMSENVACKVINSAGQARYVNTTVTLAEDEIITYVYIQYGADVTVNTTLYPMIQLAGTNNTYEPYKANTAFITSGMPLCSIGDVHDELIYNADGTGKVIKKLGVFTIDGTETYKMYSGTTTQINISDAKYNTIKFMTQDTEVPNVISTVFTAERANYIWYGYRDNSIGLYGTVLVHSSRFATADDAKTYFTENPAIFVTELAEPQEIELSVAEIAELQQLHSFNGITNIYNSGNGEMYIRAMTTGFEYGHEVGFFDSKV